MLAGRLRLGQLDHSWSRDHISSLAGFHALQTRRATHRLANRPNERVRWPDSCSGNGVGHSLRAVVAAGKGEMHMAGKNTAAFGIYSNRVQVEQGIDSLLAARFRNEDISVLFPDNEGTKDFAHQKNTKAPEGATAGVGAGGAIGGTLGLLVGIGVLAIPGLGPFIAAGPIMAALAGMGVGGAVGGLVGALVGMGIPEYEAIRYDGLSLIHI